MDYKTPGIFVEQVNAPVAVTAAGTATPAFIGYTELTMDLLGNSLVNVSTLLSSFQEFNNIFGGNYIPPTYTVQVNPAASFLILKVIPEGGKNFYLSNAIRHYFDNGGGPCYIVSVGDYTAGVIYGTDTTGLRGGILSLEKNQDITLIAVPDIIALKQPEGAPDFVLAGNVHKDIIAQCAKLQDRFGILDLLEGYLPPNDLVTAPIDQFRKQVGNNNLRYAAAYYPWLNTSYQTDIRFEQLKFIDNQVVTVPISDATINTMTGNKIFDGLVSELRLRIAEEQLVFSKITGAAINESNYNSIPELLQTFRNAVMAATTAASVRPAFAAMLKFVRELALAFQDLKTDTDSTVEILDLLSTLETDYTLTAQLTLLIAFEKNPGVMNSISTVRAESDVTGDYISFDLQGWVGGASVASITANTSDFTNGGANTVAQTAKTAASSPEFQNAFNAVAQAFAEIAGGAVHRENQAETLLFGEHPFFIKVIEQIQKEMSLLPPSGAVAGIFASIDRTRGVWKAPANVSLQNVISPAYKLNDLEQGPLNVHETGKSINVIRAFTNNGSIVWGARTLAGNDSEWRFINVRRFFMFVESSTKNAAAQFVFEPNDAQTWVRVRAMIENFLTKQWRRGALTGTTAKDAFFVRVGLGETMQNTDILEGKMIVEIGLAVARPAEFIVFTFSQAMQDS